MLLTNCRTYWLVAISCLLVAAPAWAQPVVEWVVDVDGLWEDPANWSSNRLPGAGDDVLIDRPDFALLITHSTGNVSIRSLTSEESLALLGGSFTVGGGTSVVRGDLVVASNRNLVATGDTTSLAALGAVVFDGANLFATAGATLDLSTATSYTHTNGNFQARTLRADGMSSLLDLSGMTVINGAHGIGAALFIQALNGGLVDLRSVVEIPVGATILSAIGPDSTIDLTALTRLLHTGGNTVAKLEARGGGTLVTPNLVTVSRVDIILDDVSQITTNAIEIYNSGTATLTAVAADFSRATNITAANFNLSGGATVDLRNASVISRAGFNVADGVTLALPAATAYALNGGNFDNRFLVARGAASLLDLSTLTTVSGGGAQYQRCRRIRFIPPRSIIPIRPTVAGVMPPQHGQPSSSGIPKV